MRVAGQMLDLELACTNTGEAPLGFTAALHPTCASTISMPRAWPGFPVFGTGTRCCSAMNCSEVELLLPGDSGVVDLDRICFQAKEPLLLSEHRLNGRVRRVLITSQGFDDAVVWNPGPERCAKLADMPADGWRHMLCVEAACIGILVELPAGETWGGSPVAEPRIGPADAAAPSPPCMTWVRAGRGAAQDNPPMFAPLPERQLPARLPAPAH